MRNYREGDRETIRRRAAERERRRRWEAPGRARVVHRERGEVVVPCMSPLAAIMCAAEEWKCDWAKITDAEVWRV